MNITKRPPYQPQRDNDDDFCKWLKTQSCSYCGSPPPNDPAHVRLNGRGGMGTKPKFSAVPLCRSCHSRSHGKDYLLMLNKDEWLRLADKYLNLWKNQK